MPADDDVVNAPQSVPPASGGVLAVVIGSSLVASPFPAGIVAESESHAQPHEASAVGAYLDNTRSLHRTFAREFAAVVESLTSTDPTRPQERVTC